MTVGMKRVRRALAVSAAVCAIAWACAFPALADGETTFVSNTYVNGTAVAGLTVDEAKAHLENPDSYELVIEKKDGSTEVIRGSEIGYRAVVTGDLGSILAEQNAGGRVIGPAVRYQFTVEVAASYDEAALTARIQNLSVMKNEGVTVTQDARISDYREGMPYVILSEVYGNDVDPEKTQAAILQAAASGQSRVNLEEQGCYRTVAVTKDDAALKNQMDLLNGRSRMKITYDFGEVTGEDGTAEPVTEMLEGSRIAGWITGTADGQVQLNREAVAEYVKELASRYDTSGTARMFYTVTGREVELTGPYGWKIDQEKETDALIAAIQTGEMQTREPVYAASAVSRTAPEWGTTYAEVDLTGQHVYMVKDGVVVWDAPCVTGNTSKNYTTPPGLYSITYKQRDKVLRGKKLANGQYEYESPVSYWMPFNGGIGFHDANWRSDFGGEIYKTGGSHGCVNLPPSRVPEFFEMVYTGMPVICYN